MKKKLGMDSILTDEKGEWWENMECIIVRVVFEPASAAKSLTSFLTSFLRCHKDITYLYEYFGHAWPNPSKIILSTCKGLSWFSAYKTLTSQLNLFLRYYKQNILVILNTFGIPGHTQIINFIPHFFLEIL